MCEINRWGDAKKVKGWSYLYSQHRKQLGFNYILHSHNLNNLKFDINYHQITDCIIWFYIGVNVILSLEIGIL